MDKTYDSATEAIADMSDGVTLLCGGFGLSGNPENLITALHERGTKNITLVSNNAGNRSMWSRRVIASTTSMQDGWLLCR